MSIFHTTNRRREKRLVILLFAEVKKITSLVVSAFNVECGKSLDLNNFLTFPRAACEPECRGYIPEDPSDNHLSTTPMLGLCWPLKTAGPGAEAPLASR